MLECCRSLEEVRKDGISFDELACLARCNSLNVVPKRPLYRHEYENDTQMKPRVVEQSPPRNVPFLHDINSTSLHSNNAKHSCPLNMESTFEQEKLHMFHPYDNYLSLDEFRSDVLNSCSRSNGPVLVVSYSRKQFLQTGDGHFSPIGGYHRKEDKVLILDTARFKYPPHWVDLEMLYHSMCRLDLETNLTRGWMLWDVANGIKKDPSSIGKSDKFDEKVNHDTNEKIKNPGAFNSLSDSQISKTFVFSPKYFSFFFLNSKEWEVQNMADELGSELISHSTRITLDKKNGISIGDSFTLPQSKEILDEQSIFHTFLIQEVLKFLNIRASKELVLKSRYIESSFDDENTEVTPNNRKRAKPLPTKPISPGSEQKLGRNICDIKRKSILRFCSPIAIRVKCCDEEFNDVNNFVKDVSHTTSLSCENGAKCSSKCTRNGNYRLSQEIQRTRLYRLVKIALDSNLEENLSADDPCTERGAEMFTLLLFILLKDEDLFEFQEISKQMDSRTPLTYHTEKEKRSSIWILKDISIISSSEFPELAKELQCLSYQWVTLKNYCRVVMNLPVLETIA